MPAGGGSGCWGCRRLAGPGVRPGRARTPHQHPQLYSECFSLCLGRIIFSISHVRNVSCQRPKDSQNILHASLPLMLIFFNIYIYFPPPPKKQIYKLHTYFPPLGLGCACGIFRSLADFPTVSLQPGGMGNSHSLSEKPLHAPQQSNTSEAGMKLDLVYSFSIPAKIPPR